MRELLVSCEKPSTVVSARVSEPDASPRFDPRSPTSVPTSGNAFSALANTEITNFAVGEPIPVPSIPHENCPLYGSSSPLHYTHGGMQGLDGDRWHDNNANSAGWKNYGQFTLRASGPHPSCSACITPSHRPQPLIHPPRTRTSCHGDTIFKEECIAVARPRQRDCRGQGVPLVVLLKPSILGILPVSLLPAVVTLLDVPGAATGGCIVLPWVW